MIEWILRMPMGYFEVLISFAIDLCQIYVHVASLQWSLRGFLGISLLKPKRENNISFIFKDIDRIWRGADAECLPQTQNMGGRQDSKPVVQVLLFLRFRLLSYHFNPNIICTVFIYTGEMYFMIVSLRAEWHSRSTSEKKRSISRKTSLVTFALGNNLT